MIKEINKEKETKSIIKIESSFEGVCNVSVYHLEKEVNLYADDNHPSSWFESDEEEINFSNNSAYRKTIATSPFDHSFDVCDQQTHHNSSHRANYKAYEEIQNTVLLGINNLGSLVYSDLSNSSLLTKEQDSDRLNMNHKAEDKIS
jgi:hypothetical protein